MLGNEKLSKMIKAEASRLGFLSCGIAKARFLEEEAPRLEQWLKKSFHGKMHYMENHFDKRLDPTKLVEDAKSVISLTYNYYTDKKFTDPDTYQISKYAYGNDYHFVIKEKLKELLAFICRQSGEIHARVFVDSAPVLDKMWAREAGLGWIGKHSNLLSKQTGSYFFIAEIITDLSLTYDIPVADHCGTCTRCIDACPTEAIVAPYVVDGSKCISYFTIELKDEIPTEVKGKFENWIFGCDICQDVCPWNRFAKPHTESAFEPDLEFLAMNKRDWKELTEETFNILFKDSPLKRTGFKGLKRTIDFLEE